MDLTTFTKAECMERCDEILVTACEHDAKTKQCFVHTKSVSTEVAQYDVDYTCSVFRRGIANNVDTSTINK